MYGCYFLVQKNVDELLEPMRNRNSSTFGSFLNPSILLGKCCSESSGASWDKQTLQFLESFI